VIALLAGTVSVMSDSIDFRTCRLANSGMNGSMESSSRIWQSSMRIIVATAVTSLVRDAMRKIVSISIGGESPKARLPIVSTC
jgi:hypothetical protein